MAVQKTFGAATDAAVSAEDLRGKEYHTAVRNADGQFELSEDDGPVAGVIQEGKDVGYWSSISTGGIAKVVAASPINAGQRVASAAGGQAKAGNTNSYGEARNTVVAGAMVEVVCDRT